MTQVTIDNTSPNLIDDIGADLTGWIVEEFFPEDAAVSNQRWQVVFNAEAGRAGLVFVGSGSSGHTFWTDAVSAEDAYTRLLNDELAN